MKLKSFVTSDVGMRREKNEDSFLIDEDIGLFIVADGMGGHVGGEKASRLAVTTIDSIIKEALTEVEAASLENDGIFAGAFSDGQVRTHIKKAIQDASHRIYEEAKNDPSLRGMGTTTVMLLIRNNRAYIANVGDSRGYLVRDGKVTQLTLDHSLVGEQLRAGVISEDAAKDHKLKNIITRSVGFQEEVEIDIISKIPKNEDIFVLCSDGLTNLVENGEILEVISEHTLEEAGQILVDMANGRGGDDNITVVLIKFDEIEDINEAPDDEESTIGI